MTSPQEMPGVPAEVLEYLQSHDSLTLSIATPSSGAPHAATLPYVNEQVTLYVALEPGSIDTRNLGGHPTVSFSIDDPEWESSASRSLRGEGRAAQVDETPGASRIRGLFREKYRTFSSAGASIVRITPTLLELVDSGAQPETGIALEERCRIISATFPDIPEGEVEPAAQAMTPVEIAPGEAVVRQGQSGDRFFVIARGEVEVMHEEEGAIRTVARLQQGSYFGEMAILREMPRTATVRAVIPTTLLAMDREAFQAMVAHSLGVQEDLDAVMQQRMENLRTPPRIEEE